jgi:23S rRNA pseudouridine955/2504/2580 synthase
MFREHGAGADKRYLVLVKGRWMNNTQHVKAPLLKYLTDSGERRVSVHAEGKASHTVFRLLARWPEMSLLEAQLKTGRTHQIRVHLKSLGHILLGDVVYGWKPDPRLNLQPPRVMLHAEHLVFTHPVTNKTFDLRAPLPLDFTVLIKALRTAVKTKPKARRNRPVPVPAAHIHEE